MRLLAARSGNRAFQMLSRKGGGYTTSGGYTTYNPDQKDLDDDDLSDDEDDLPGPEWGMVSEPPLKEQLGEDKKQKSARNYTTTDEGFLSYTTGGSKVDAKDDDDDNDISDDEDDDYEVPKAPPPKQARNYTTTEDGTLSYTTPGSNVDAKDDDDDNDLSDDEDDDYESNVPSIAPPKPKTEGKKLPPNYSTYNPDEDKHLDDDDDDDVELPSSANSYTTSNGKKLAANYSVYNPDEDKDLDDDDDDDEVVSWTKPKKPKKTPKPKARWDLKSKSMLEGHKTESEGSFDLTEVLITNKGGLVDDMIRAGIAQPGETPQSIYKNKPRLRAAVKRLWGWSDDDVDRFWKLSAMKGNKGKEAQKAWKVDYLKTEEDRAKYAVTPGPTWTEATGKPFDTSSMASKAAGPGYCIFVMDVAGRVFAGQHRVGLFHHSSFMKGKDVAAAGELKVSNGQLKSVTAKSGHYQPTPEYTLQFLKVLNEKGVKLAGVEVKIWRQNPKNPGNPHDQHTWIYDADEFFKKGLDARGRNTGKKF